MLRGWGELNTFHTPILNNGLFIADGFGEAHDLFFSGYNYWILDHHYFTNTIPNTTTNGWYARNGGRLLAPAVWLDGPGDYNWGENPGNGELGVVNSVRAKFPAVQGGEVYLKVDIPAADRAEIPQPPSPEPAVGLWQISLPQADGGTLLAGLEFRYDHLAARGRVPELHQYNPQTGGWTLLKSAALPGHRVATSAASTFNNNDLGLIAAIRPKPTNVFF